MIRRRSSSCRTLTRRRRCRSPHCCRTITAWSRDGEQKDLYPPVDADRDRRRSRSADRRAGRHFVRGRHQRLRWIRSDVALRPEGTRRLLHYLRLCHRRCDRLAGRHFGLHLDDLVSAERDRRHCRCSDRDRCLHGDRRAWSARAGRQQFPVHAGICRHCRQWLLALDAPLREDGMTSAPRPLVTAERRDEDAAEATLRPQRLAEFIGQEQARKNLGVFIAAARGRKEALDHVLFVGPPGLGKTTLAQIVARELGVNFRATSGPVIAKAGDLAALLTNLEERDVLFIDEIHRLNPAVEEILYPAMEDFQLDLIIGAGPAARSVKIDLAKFTLVGATTRAGLLTNPLRDRFGIPVRLNFYTVPELEQIVNRGARVLGIGVTADGSNEIARRARGTPRIAGRLLRRVRDFALVGKAAAIDREVADRALLALEVDATGLDAMDRRYLTTVALNYGGGPVGIETIAAALSEPRDAIEEIIEPYLIQQGFIQRTPRGRLLTSHAFRHLGVAEPRRDSAQFGMFGDDPDGGEDGAPPDAARG